MPSIFYDYIGQKILSSGYAAGGAGAFGKKLVRRINGLALSGMITETEASG